MVMTASDAVWAAAVFAHNESAFIAATLESLPAAADGHRVEVFVLINGCTDLRKRSSRNTPSVMLRCIPW
jgi:hypothetical protein